MFDAWFGKNELIDSKSLLLSGLSKLNDEQFDCFCDENVDLDSFSSFFLFANIILAENIRLNVDRLTESDEVFRLPKSSAGWLFELDTVFGFIQIWKY